MPSREITDVCFPQKMVMPAFFFGEETTIEAEVVGEKDGYCEIRRHVEYDKYTDTSVYLFNKRGNICYASEFFNQKKLSPFLCRFFSLKSQGVTDLMPIGF